MSRKIVWTAGFAGLPVLNPREVGIRGIEMAQRRYRFYFVQRGLSRRRTPPNAAHIDAVNVVKIDVQTGNVRCDHLKIQKVRIRRALEANDAGSAILIV